MILLKYLVFTMKKSNFPVENPGRHHFNQVIKANVTGNAYQYNVLPIVMSHLTVYDRKETYLVQG